MTKYYKMKTDMEIKKMLLSFFVVSAPLKAECTGALNKTF